MKLEGFFSEGLWFFILLAVVLALATPRAGLYVTPYAIYFLLVVMFLTSLGISLSDVKKALGHKRPLAIALALVFVISPLIALLIAVALPFVLSAELAAGLILYSATPAAMANAFFLRKFGKDAALGLVITTLTTLAAPIATPLVVKALTGFIVYINPLDLFLSLAKIIILPFVVAELFKRYAKKTANKILKHSAPISSICIFFVIFGVISAGGGKLWDLGTLALVMSGYIAICCLLGYILGGKNRFVLSFSNGFRNGTLTVVVALEVFGPNAALVGVMSTLVHNVVLVPLVFKYGKY